MAESAGVRIDTTACRKELAAIDKRVDRATMWGVREAGRLAKTEMRRRAPRYSGPPKKGVQPGLLRKSISSARNLKRVDGGYVNTVGPRGPVVGLYARKIEVTAHYAAGGYSAAMAGMGAAFSKGWARAMAKH